ncbi:MAG: 3-isopropylmalate dehydratase small subunit [Aminobacterium sp.]|jgi:3-isopropylmalate/(R)-2-methylmalate dehydratase small subunit|uniref:3-isopropylmalate dehydratase small subunit n=1 Tax=unclassified Aminobacterium TaxID=2685012 RepID=UPI001BCE44FA|nr:MULTISPECIES: 3-isopropylmalate dehydratase small subunit [unclassified Aminobacterium]MDD2207512.1 3-isopropylmalate dehydratase small subunit [Aminobacterium sp.]MDD3426891.1 3-isopropylmalate dehydratase small subunit [Aminobacterium sp.]MDD3707470.1 3-isopropylmalate dehydratase small subunit [Aminobacterium sp.]MDD4229490.1 3-isopropylmalate dehydratase small subunit [Aminobacterium sp.]MDD4552321.1 3-isopropylmalate dehydratase small subunit [Aminobacterium sp.]
MAQNLQGKAWTFSDNIDTDVIIPARYLTSSNETELGSHCMEDIDAEFSKKVASGDIIVAGENFGCGSSREHAPLAIKGAGCSCVITASFARIFFRNAINVGLPIFECPEAVAAIENGDELIIKPEEGTIENISQGKVFSVVPFSPFLQELIEQGGLIPYVQKQLSVRGE